MTGQIKDQILYEDDAVLVCRKPAGIPVQTARAGQQDMVSLLRNYRAASSDPCAAVTCRSSNLRGRQIRSKKRERVSAACALLLQTWVCAPGDKEKDGV